MAAAQELYDWRNDYPYISPRFTWLRDMLTPSACIDLFRRAERYVNGNSRDITVKKVYSRLRGDTSLSPKPDPKVPAPPPPPPPLPLEILAHIDSFLGSGIENTIGRENVFFDPENPASFLKWGLCTYPFGFTIYNLVLNASDSILIYTRKQNWNPPLTLERIVNFFKDPEVLFIVACLSLIAKYYAHYTSIVCAYRPPTVRAALYFPRWERKRDELAKEFNVKLNAYMKFEQPFDFRNAFDTKDTRVLSARPLFLILFDDRTCVSGFYPAPYDDRTLETVQHVCGDPSLRWATLGHFLA